MFASASTRKVSIFVSGQYAENYGSRWKMKGSHEEHLKTVTVADLVANGGEIFSSLYPEAMEKGWSDEGSSFHPDRFEFFPAGLSEFDRSAWMYEFFEEVTSLSAEDIAYWSSPAGLFLIKLLTVEWEGFRHNYHRGHTPDPAPLPYEEYADLEDWQ